MDQIPKPAAAPTNDNPSIVAFDFDGTLTCRDSFVDFVRWAIPRQAWLAAAGRLIVPLLIYILDRDRGALKAKTLRAALGPVTREALAEAASRFQASVAQGLLRPDALACWRRWRDAGAKVYIVTASPEIIVAPFARALGADGLIGTRLEFDGGDRLSGRTLGRNCRAEEKVKRIRALLGDEVSLAAAYGDTSGDREMLAIARVRGFRVFTQRP